MGWLLSILRAAPALKNILKQLRKVFRNAKADHHVADNRSRINDAIQRVHDKQSEASERPEDT